VPPRFPIIIMSHFSFSFPWILLLGSWGGSKNVLSILLAFCVWEDKLCLLSLCWNRAEGWPLTSFEDDQRGPRESHSMLCSRGELLGANWIGPIPGVFAVIWCGGSPADRPPFPLLDRSFPCRISPLQRSQSVSGQVFFSNSFARCQASPWTD